MHSSAARLLLSVAFGMLPVLPATARPVQDGRIDAPNRVHKGEKKAPLATTPAPSPASPIPQGQPVLMPPPSNDDCSTLLTISGSGPFAFDNSQATQGTQGQTNFNCVYFGVPGIGHDLWYRWTAPVGGTGVISICGQSVVDTKVAIYDGIGCAAAASAAMSCNDDACGPYQSQTTFIADGGHTYTIQLGTYPDSPGGVGTFTIDVLTPATNDACSNPTIISGTGTFPFDNTQASGGPEAQNHPACNFHTLTGIDNDVWFRWTAPSTGVATVSLCGQTAMDSKLAAYAGIGCPAGSPLACNDDLCDVQSRISFACTSGSTYTLQLGTYPGEPGTVGTFSIAITQPATNDSCASATPISGVGTFAFDNSLATTGPQGQANTSCDFFGAIGIEQDVWFRWTAPTSGQASLSTCNLAFGLDSKVAVYTGAGCPVAQAIACSDDTCGRETKVCWNAVAGGVYMLQIGTSPNTTGAPGTTGQFTLSVGLPVAGCRYDDGVSDNAIGLVAGGTAVWLQRFGDAGSSTRVSSISAVWGSAAFPETAPSNGTSAVVAIWDDPNDDGDPIDLVLLAQVATTVQGTATDTFHEIALPAPVVASGVFFVGAGVQHAPGNFPAPADESTCEGSVGRAWFAGRTSGAYDYTTISNNDVLPAELDTLGLPGVWLLRAGCCGTLGVSFCFGDGSLPVPCPCAPPNTVPNPSGAPDAGCANSFNLNGGKLCATGTTNPDTVELLGTGLSPVGFAFFISGTAELGTPLVSGDGLRCVGGALTRFGSQNAVGGAVVYPNPALGFTAPLSVFSGVTPGSGQVRRYQIFYRNTTPGFCSAGTTNISSGVRLTW